MLFTFALIASLTSHFIGQSEAFNCLIPKFHYPFYEPFAFISHFVRYDKKEKTTVLYFWGNNIREGSPYTQAITSTNFKDWTEITQKQIPEGLFPLKSNLLYTVNDKYNSSGRFEDKPGHILAFWHEDEFDIFTEVDGKFHKIATGPYDSSGTVTYWIPPVYDEPRKRWVAVNFTHFLTSKDLVNWNPSFPLHFETNEKNLKYFDDFFTISRIDNANDVKWVIISNDYSNVLKFYNIFEFTDDGIATILHNGRFEYGADLQELCSFEPHEYGLKEVKFIAFITTFTLNRVYKQSDCWSGSLSIVRNCQLHKTNTGYVLKVFPYQPEPIHGSKIVFPEKKLVSGTTTISETAGKVFKLTARLFPKTATKYGLEIFKSSESSFQIFHDISKRKLCVDRSKSTKNSIGHYKDELYMKMFCAPIPVLCEKDLEFETFVDNMIVETFDLNGMFSFTHVVFTDDGANEVSAFTDGDVSVTELSIIIFQSQ